MPRVARLKIDNAIYHLFNRGNQKQEVFHDEEDFQTFLSILAHYKLKYGFKNHHFILMPNHFHFIWWIENAEIMPKAMKEITQTYTRAYHRKYKTVGHLWQGRYKNMITDEKKYLDRLAGYIERNAVRAKLVKEPGQWKWSSYRFYAYGEPLRILTTNLNGEKVWVELIDEDPLYKNFGSTPEKRQKNYRKFVLGIDDKEVKKVLGLIERRGRPRKR